MSVREYLAVTAIIRSQHGEFSLCDINTLAYYSSIALPPLCILLVIFRWFRQGVASTPPQVTPREFSQLYTQALENLAQKANLFLRLLDLIVVADPLNLGERCIIREKFRKAIKSPPADLCLGREEGMRVEDWAEVCWDEYVIGAAQPLPKDLYKQRVVTASNSADNDSDEDDDQSESCDEGDCDTPFFRRKRAARTAAYVWDWKSDVCDEWPASCDLLQTCGFTTQDLSSFSGNVVSVSDLIPLLARRANESGYTFISTHDGDSDAFLFVRISDIPAVQAILHSLFPEAQDNKRHRLYGGNRIIMPGESYFYPGLTLDEAEQKDIRACNSWNRVLARRVPLPLIFLGSGVGLLACLAATFCAIGWACKNSTIVAWIAWIVAAVFDCVAMSLPIIFTLIVLAVVCKHMATCLLNCLRRESRADQRRARTKGRPEGLPMPNELLQL